MLFQTTIVRVCLMLGHDGGNKNIPDVASTSETNSSSGQNAQHMFETDFEFGHIQVSISRCLDARTLEGEHIVVLVGYSLNSN